MIKPIPKRMLPHSCTYKKYLGNTGEGDSWKEEVTLTNIKIEQKLQFNLTANGREVIGNTRMFYDYVNSNGLTDVLNQNDIIIFNNHEYRVFDTEVLCANSSVPHHYEVILK